jgi:hypothetical protein
MRTVREVGKGVRYCGAGEAITQKRLCNKSTAGNTTHIVMEGGGKKEQKTVRGKNAKPSPPPPPPPTSPLATFVCMVKEASNTEVPSGISLSV